MALNPHYDQAGADYHSAGGTLRRARSQRISLPMQHIMAMIILFKFRGMPWALFEPTCGKIDGLPIGGGKLAKAPAMVAALYPSPTPLPVDA